LEGHKDTIYAIDVQNGIIASASKDATVKIWDIERKKAWTF
jgi:WD40 repeat protein